MMSAVCLLCAKIVSTNAFGNLVLNKNEIV